LRSRALQGKAATQTDQSDRGQSGAGASLAWGVCPEGFTRLVDGEGNRLVVRQDQTQYVNFSLCVDGPAKVDGESHYYGRGTIRLRHLANGETAVIRRYLHGGALLRVTGAWFFTWPPRPFRELAITEELRRRGLRTVEVYAACISRPTGPFYRGWLITRQLPGAEDLWSALRSGLAERLGLERALEIAAESVAALHREGVYHADLNLKNILLRAEESSIAAYIIDFDKAKLLLGKLPPPLRTKNLARLERSVRKLDPERRFLTAAAWDRFMSCYHAACRS